MKRLTGVLMEISLQGPMAGAVVAVVGLYLVFGPIEQLARKPSPVKRRRLARQDVPTWMTVFFRGLGIVLLALAGLLLAPLFGRG